MLESRDLTKKFGAKTAVDAVSIVMEPGHVYAMLGPNGSGKTTWMKMAAGLIKPTSGEVLFALPAATGATYYKPGLLQLVQSILDPKC